MSFILSAASVLGFKALTVKNRYKTCMQIYHMISKDGCPVLGSYIKGYRALHSLKNIKHHQVRAGAEVTMVTPIRTFAIMIIMKFYIKSK